MRPLAERMRPRGLEDMVGQRRLLAPGSALRRAVESGHVHSMILWGPPGCGKTTLALLLAKYCDAEFRAISAVLASAEGTSANNCAICAAVLKYCSRVNLRTRRWLPRISPSAMQTRASCARKSRALRSTVTPPAGRDAPDSHRGSGALRPESHPPSFRAARRAMQAVDERCPGEPGMADGDSSVSARGTMTRRAFALGAAALPALAQVRVDVLAQLGEARNLGLFGQVALGFQAARGSPPTSTGSRCRRTCRRCCPARASGGASPRCRRWPRSPKRPGR